MYRNWSRKANQKLRWNYIGSPKGRRDGDGAASPSKLSNYLWSRLASRDSLGGLMELIRRMVGIRELPQRHQLLMPNLHPPHPRHQLSVKGSSYLKGRVPKSPRKCIISILMITCNGLRDSGVGSSRRGQIWWSDMMASLQNRRPITSSSSRPYL